MEEKEIWRPILEMENRYEVSSLGRVRSIINRDNIRLLTDKYYTHDGYKVVTLCKDGKWKPYRVNRLVAIAFIPNPNNYPQVDHINEIKADNRIENLEWCSPKYNILHSRVIDKMNKATRKAVDQYSMANEFIKTYISINDASRCLNINVQNICSCCQRKRRQAGGYIWRYHNEKQK